MKLQKRNALKRKTGGLRVRRPRPLRQLGSRSSLLRLAILPTAGDAREAHHTAEDKSNARRFRRGNNVARRDCDASVAVTDASFRKLISARVEGSAAASKESAVADFLASALPLANAEAGTTAWFALKFGPSTFGVFDAFADEAGRQAHLQGQIAAALMANAAALLAEPPKIEKVELLAAKLPG